MIFDWTKAAGLLAIAAGFGIMYYPPALLGTGAGTVAFATTLVAAGFGAIGVPLALASIQARARGEREGTIRANRVAGARAGAQTRRARKAPPAGPDDRP